MIARSIGNEKGKCFSFTEPVRALPLDYGCCSDALGERKNCMCLFVSCTENKHKWCAHSETNCHLTSPHVSVEPTGGGGLTWHVRQEWHTSKGGDISVGMGDDLPSIDWRLWGLKPMSRRAWTMRSSNIPACFLIRARRQRLVLSLSLFHHLA